MSVKNLHSLINGRWFIDKPYGHSLLPSLFSILEGKDVSIKSGELEPEIFISLKKSNASIIAASGFDSGNNDSEYVAVINLKDPIYKYNQECGPSGTKSKMQGMRSYAQDPNCIGVVLDIDSGGGQVSGTPEFYDFIRAFKKPVVSYTDGLMCSAAYYIGSAASHIIANKRADAIGSIGVMVSFIDFSGIYEKQGAKLITEYATQSTEKNKAFEELLKGNPDLYIKTELDPIAEDFINDIKAVRPGIDPLVFKGGTWNAQESLDKKLIDSIGTLQDAVNKVFELSDTGNSNNNSNQNKKKSMSNTKGFPVLQGILGIEGTGIATISTITGKKGVQITEAQLETLEANLAAQEAALTAANTKATTAVSAVTALEGVINTAVTTAGLEKAVEATATTESKITLLSATVVKYGKQSGAIITKPKAEGDSFEEADSIVNAADSHNDAYNKA
ncbi:MAG: S49 family peptidase [Flavobacterium sp.]|nr:S49 family peptidase [Flavobacterium sp.]